MKTNRRCVHPLVTEEKLGSADHAQALALAAVAYHFR
jgi:hypothetical protein